MTTPADLGMVEPTGTDFISSGDDAISQNARATALLHDSLVAKILDAKWLKGVLGPFSEYTDPDTLTEGIFEVQSGTQASAVGLPVGQSGFVLHVIFDGSSIEYFFTALGQIWSRFGNPTTWSTWKRSDGFAPDSQYARTDNVTYGGIVDFATAPARVYSVWNASDADVMNLPVRAPGQVYLGTSGSSFRTLLFITVTDPVQMWAARYTNSTGFSEWKRVDAGAVESGGDGGPSSGFKNVALPLTQQSGGGTETVSDDAIRFPIGYGVGAKRARLHVQNWNYFSGAKQIGAVEFTGAWFGSASGQDFTTAPAKVLGAFTTPANGDKYTSPWFNIEYIRGTESLLSVGFANASGQVNAQSRTGCYRSGNSADAALSSGFPGVLSTEAPFDVWLEFEVPADTPVVGAFGDSNAVGSGSTLPVHDAWISQYCRSAGALPYFMAVHGSNSGSWDDPASPAWDHYEGAAKPDSVVYFLGQNDLQEGVTLGTLQANLAKVLPIVRG